jgi:hypothetical protein
MVDFVFHFVYTKGSVHCGGEHVIIYRSRTHINPFHDLALKLKNALYASCHFLVFPLFILDIEMRR